MMMAMTQAKIGRSMKIRDTESYRPAGAWLPGAPARCGALGIGLLSGGYGRDELERSGAIRVYDDPADLLVQLDEIAPRTRD